MIKSDIAVREIVQREDFLLRKLKLALYQIETTEKRSCSQKDLDEWKSELDELHQAYWRVDRELSLGTLCWSDNLHRPIFEAYRNVREDPNWYLDGLLSLDCKSRGGCCGRECKCCARPRSATRARNKGHCAKNCGCCFESRGFELNEDQQKLCQPDFDLTKGFQKADDYSIFLFKAYILGLRQPGWFLSWRRG